MQILAADWCKYNDCVMATGSVDKSIKTWDVRMPQREVAVLTGHTYAVRGCCSQMHTMPFSNTPALCRCLVTFCCLFIRCCSSNHKMAVLLAVYPPFLVVVPRSVRPQILLPCS